MDQSAFPHERWERWLGTYVPFGALAVATVLALLTGEATGATNPTWRLVTQLVLVAVTGFWLWWCTIRHAELGSDPLWMRVCYVVRTVLALALTLLNPMFCVFAWVGYIDCYDAFRRRGRWVAVGVTALIMATGQAGGVPLEWSAAVAMFLGLFAVNFALGGVFSSFGNSMWVSNQQRAAAIGELEELNADLERTMAENTRLHETVVAQARRAGIQQERGRIAQDIHDTLAQSLAGIVAQLQASAAEPDLPAVRDRVSHASALAREALTEARRSIMDLAPAPLETGSLAGSVTAMVDSWSAAHAVEADTVIAGDPRPLHPEVEAAALRIAQEALANVAKHARADRVGLTLTYDEQELILDVRDDGIGFVPATPASGDSFGLRGMQLRSEHLAGVLDVESAPGDGTAVSVRLPALARGAS